MKIFIVEMTFAKNSFVILLFTRISLALIATSEAWPLALKIKALKAKTTRFYCIYLDLG
jgi:hypothetical protein